MTLDLLACVRYSLVCTVRSDIGCVYTTTCSNNASVSRIFQLKRDSKSSFQNPF